MATIYLMLSKKSDTNPQKEIRIRFKHGKVDQQTKTNIFIPAKFWNRKAMRIIIPNYRLMSEDNSALTNYLAMQSEKLRRLTTAIQTSFNNVDKSNVAPNWLKLSVDKFNFPEKYAPRAATPEITTVFQFMDKFIKEAPNRKDKITGRSLTYSNIQKYNATVKHVIHFADTIRKRDFYFSDINQSFYDRFVAFLQKKSFTQNSVGKHIRVLKLMLNEATAHGYNTDASYKSFHAFTEETDSIYLNETELQNSKMPIFPKSPILTVCGIAFCCWRGQVVAFPT